MTKTGAGTLSLRDLTIGPNGTVNLSRGTLRFNGYSRADGSTFNFHSGTIQLGGNRSIGTDTLIEEKFGPVPTITTGKGLTVEGTATLLTALTVDGGTLTVGGLAGPSELQFKHGTLNVTDLPVTVGAGAPLGSTLLIDATRACASPTPSRSTAARI